MLATKRYGTTVQATKGAILIVDRFPLSTIETVHAAHDSCHDMWTIVQRRRLQGQRGGGGDFTLRVDALP